MVAARTKGSADEIKSEIFNDGVGGAGTCGLLLAIYMYSKLRDIGVGRVGGGGGRTSPNHHPSDNLNGRNECNEIKLA